MIEIYLSIYLPIYLSIYVSIYLSIYLSISLSLSLFLFLYLCVYVLGFVVFSVWCRHRGAAATVAAAAGVGQCFVGGSDLVVNRSGCSCQALVQSRAGDPEDALRLLLEVRDQDWTEFMKL